MWDRELPPLKSALQPNEEPTDAKVHSATKDAALYREFKVKAVQLGHMEGVQVKDIAIGSYMVNI